MQSSYFPNFSPNPYPSPRSSTTFLGHHRSEILRDQSPSTRRTDTYNTDSHQKLDLFASNKGNKVKRTQPLVGSCVSGSGETLAIIRENEFWVYRVSYPLSVNFRYVGIVDSKGLFHHGKDPAEVQAIDYIMNSKPKPGFSCVATSDNLLAVGAEGVGIVLFFAIGEGESARYLFQLNRAGCVVRKLVFNSESTELAVIYTAPQLKKDVCEIYSVADLRTPSTPAHGSSEPGSITLISTLLLDTTYQSKTDRYTYTTRDVKFSLDGSKLVLCTTHNHGSALVFIMLKDIENQNEWKLWGRDCLIIETDNWDNNCLGLTGVSLYDTAQTLLMTSYRRREIDDSLLFSLDFEKGKIQERYRIEPEEEGFILASADKRREGSGDRGRGLAISVSSHGDHDIVAILRDDGNHTVSNKT